MRGFAFLLFCFAFADATAAQEQSKGWGWLGVELSDVTKAEADKLGWDTPAGAKVVSIDAKGPATKKLRPGDIILVLDGAEVENKAQFETAVAAKLPETEIKLKVRRGRNEKRIAVVLAASPTEKATSVAQEAPAPPAPKEESPPERPVTAALSPAELALLNGQESFRDCPDCPEMVKVPAGSFMMGSPESEPDRSVNESPQHEVTFAKPFAVGKFQVTFAEWDACVAAGGCGHHKPKDEGWGRGSRPVINVSWDDAKAYVAWLSRKTGKSYRLLSEAEREYIARAGAATPFWWGASITPELANYDGTGDAYKGGGAKGEYRRKTMPVQSFNPTSWGIYQVHGNVYEWVEDCWHDSYEGAPTNGSAWTTGDCNYRVLRGGSWSNNPQFLRAAFRINNTPTDRDRDEGFRVARALP
jgi:formylglycine-generating enzyme required for sulfatase activity